MTAIEFRDVTITYADAPVPSLRDVSLTIEPGELALVVGRTGSGKSTFLGAINGLVPHFTGGRLSGQVLVGGRDTRTNRPRDLASVVGYVAQDPLAGFVTDTVEDELAYGMEQLGLAPQTMRKRVEETLDLLGIADLRDRALRDLSGGQQQRVAIGAVLTMHPQVIVLDEPTSALDPTGAEEVLAAITRLVHDLAVTVVVAEHRIERVVHYADSIVHVGPGGIVTHGDPASIMAMSTVAPPVVELGRTQGWRPLPLSVRDARRKAAPLRASLEAAYDARTANPIEMAKSGHLPTEMAKNGHLPTEMANLGHPDRAVTLQVRSLTVAYDDAPVVNDVDLTLRAGTVTALMGRNGSGKSTLMNTVVGLTAPRRGTVRVDAGGGPITPADLSPAQRRTIVGLVPQTAGDLLYLDTVAGECGEADRDAKATPGTCAAMLERLAPGISGDRHPRDLSEGQRLALVLAIQLTADPALILLDEPTRGLDYTAKSQLREALRACAGAGQTVLVSSHDVEFVARVADDVVLLAQGEVVAAGTAEQVLLASPSFAPQVAKILAPLPLLTVEQVEQVTTAVGAGGPEATR